MLGRIFATRRGIIGVGGFIGVFAPLLQRWGNPGNMDVCVACFERDIAGRNHQGWQVKSVDSEGTGYRVSITKD